MKIFSWLRNRRNGNEVINKPTPESMHYGMKEEFSDWPNGLLAIGTFGNNHLKQSEKLFNEERLKKSSTSAEDDEFDKELRLLLKNHHIGVDSVEELLNCLLQQDHEKTKSNSHVVLQQRGRKDVRSDNTKRRGGGGGIGKKSLSFLMKKALLCRGGFGASSSPMLLRDPLQDLKLDHSRMDKILRAMLHKKIYPQSQKASPKKCLEIDDYEEEEHDKEAENHESKWVKTDSEYIVLEI